MDRRRALSVGLVALAGALLVLTLAPGLLLDDPGGYNRTTVTAYDADGTKLATVEVRIADTPEKRYIGLSNTTSLRSDEGMLFIHPREAIQGYVMRGMSFPIDIIFVDANGTVTRVVHASVDGEDAPYRARAKYVLEVNRGWANRTGLEAGDAVKVPEDA